MILPVYLLGNNVLREQTQDLDGNSDEIQRLIDDMIETMHAAQGIGLAAPQIGRNERIFVVDVSPMEKEFQEADISMPPQPMVFINAQIVDESEGESEYEEGCLSIPDIHEVVVRPESLTMRYLDRDFQPHEHTFDGVLARVIQHEYDHVEGVLFIDHLTAFKRRLLKRRLEEIKDGQTAAEYIVHARDKGPIHPTSD
jgi:peptide deformylase